jgi:phosphatidylinositol alpha-mannosyltransferase
MKIIQLCPYAMDRPGGVQRHVRDLTTWLTAQGHETRIIAPPAPGQAARRDETLIELGKSRAFGTHGTGFELSFARPAHVRALARELTDWGADLVHMHTPWTPRLVHQMWCALHLPTVTTLHATLPDFRPNGKGASLIDRYIRRAAKSYILQSEAVILPSPAPLKMLTRLVPRFAPDILPPAVDLAPWRQAGAQQRARASLHPGLHLLFLGRLEARKGVDILLRAWPRIVQALPQARLTIAGDGEMRPMVEAAQSPRLAYVGRPDDAAARALMAKADLFIAPALYGESYGLVLAEAMAAGALPVAAANTGYASVLTGPGKQLLVPPGNPELLAERIIALSDDQIAMADLRNWAKIKARQSDIANVGPDYLALYETVLRPR